MDMNHTTIAQRATKTKEKNQESMKHLRLTRWIFLIAFMAMGATNLAAQTAAVSSTCNCPNDQTAVDRIKDIITISGTPGEIVWFDDYNFILPDGVLWRDSISDNSFYLDGDLEDTPLDTFTIGASGTVNVCVWRDPSIAFPTIGFASAGGTFSVPGPGLEVCSAVGGEAIATDAIPLMDTICLDNGAVTFSIPALGATIDPNDINWAVIPADPATGQGR